MLLDHVRVCNCSVCRKRGTLNHRVTKESFTLLTSWSDLQTYQWGSMTAIDYFCKKCGILPFRRPSNPSPEEHVQGLIAFDGWAINVRCLEGVDLESIPVEKIDGKNIRYTT